jgi:hypothetical protein
VRTNLNLHSCNSLALANIFVYLLGLEDQNLSEEMEHPTPFQDSVLEALLVALSSLNTSEAGVKGPTKMLDSPSVTNIQESAAITRGGSHILIDEPLKLNAINGGLVSPHIYLGNSSSTSMWLYRPKSNAGEGDKASGGGSKVKNFKFDFSHGTGVAQDMTDPSGKTVKSISDGKSLCLVPVAIRSGKGAWEFCITKDSMDNEMTCVGASNSLTPQVDYDYSLNLYMYRYLFFPPFAFAC